MKIMECQHKLFTPEKLSKFGITLTQQQCDNISEDYVKYLLVGGKLEPENAMMFLKQGKLEEKELKAEFDKSWNKFVENLPPVYKEPTMVEARVERRLFSFAEKLGDVVKDKLKGKRLRKSLIEVLW